MRKMAVAAVLMGACVAGATDQVELPVVGSPEWRHLDIPGVEKRTRYGVYEEDGRRILRAESDCGASGVAVAVEPLDLDRAPFLQWDWRIEQGLVIADERSKPGDDFAARVIVMFAFDAAQASFAERALHRVAETVRGETLPGRSLAYLWTSAQPEGEAWRNPYRSPTFLISLGRGVSSDWRSVSVNVHEDYRRYWKAEPPPVVGVAILTDADNTCGRAVAHYANFRFSAVDAEAGAAPTE